MLDDIFVPQAAMVYDRITVKDKKSDGWSVSEIQFFRNPVGIAGKSYGQTNVRKDNAIDRPFLVEGVILHCQDKHLWDDAWFSLVLYDRPIVLFSTAAGRLSGLASTPNTSRGHVIVYPNGPFHGELRWRDVQNIPNEVVITVIVTGRVLPMDEQRRINTMPNVPDIFAWVTAGDELPEWFKPEAFEKITVPILNDNDHEVGVVVGGIAANPEVRKESLVRRLTRVLLPQNHIKVGGIK